MMDSEPFSFSLYFVLAYFIASCFGIQTSRCRLHTKANAGKLVINILACRAGVIFFKSIDRSGRCYHGSLTLSKIYIRWLKIVLWLWKNQDKDVVTVWVWLPWISAQVTVRISISWAKSSLRRNAIYAHITKMKKILREKEPAMVSCVSFPANCREILIQCGYDILDSRYRKTLHQP